MSYEVIAIPNFKREIKKLAKKFPSLKNDFAQLLESLQEEPTQGTSLGNNCYKIRMAITSKGKGKSGGSRVITHLKVSHTSVYLLSIYDKSEQENISDKN
ncbi:MAG: type II toxin-antitoxin system RelE/ParE family toxin [Cytophagales bacterium]|nr:type II toxin-antitoxin system RelE/ParE family toxin [Cytophagales bacterium]